MRPIDADALYENFKDGKSDTEEERDFNRAARYLIKHAPTIELSVVHGRWIYVPEECGVGYDTHKCSMCNEHFVVDHGCEIPKFCPECGAKMDEGERK